MLSYDIVDNNGATIATNDELYTRYALATRTTNAIEFSTEAGKGGRDNSVYYYIKIKAVAEGGSFIYKSVIGEVIIKAVTVTCGTEVISLADSIDITHSLSIGDPNIVVDLSGAFNSDTNKCQVSTYSIKVTDASPASALNPSPS